MGPSDDDSRQNGDIPDDPDREPTALATDGVAPLINNTGLDVADDDADAPSG